MRLPTKERVYATIGTTEVKTGLFPKLSPMQQLLGAMKLT